MSLPAAPVLAALFMTGLAGSLGHCLGMCGPLVLLVGARFPRGIREAAPFHLLYQSGRITMLGLGGLVVGGISALVGQVFSPGIAQALISLALGGAVVLAGLAILGWVRLPGEARLGGLWRSLVNQAMHSPRRIGIFLLGGVNALLPCGLVYSALLVAAALGHPGWSALGMVFFGVGTFPALFAVGIGGGMISPSLRLWFARGSGLFVLLVGGQLILRGVAQLGLVSHWMLGRVMIW
jgi:sulfite exporter TauE/SafE